MPSAGEIAKSVMCGNGWSCAEFVFARRLTLRNVRARFETVSRVIVNSARPPQPKFLLFQSLPQTLQSSEFTPKARGL
jgi:hypothetical protein